MLGMMNTFNYIDKGTEPIMSVNNDHDRNSF